MKRGLLLVLVVAVALVAAAGSSSAQPKQGDLVISKTGSPYGLHYKTWPSGSLKTLTTNAIILNCAKVRHSNSYIYASGGSTGNIYRYDKNGVQVTMTTVTPSAAAIGVDQDGSHMIASSSNNTLYRLVGSSCTVWLALPTTYGTCNAICRDGSTGDWIVGTYRSGTVYLLRVNRLTKSVSAFFKQPGVGIHGVDWIPQTNEYVVAYQTATTTNRVGFVTSAGTLRAYTTVQGRVMTAVTVDQKNGRVFAASNTGWLYEWTYMGQFKSSQSLFPSGSNLSGLDIWDDQNVSIDLFGSGSNVYARAYLRFNESPSKSYYVALSTDASGGINLGASGWVNLKPNALFFATVGGGLPYFTSGFSGVLSTSGTAYARWTMPYTPLRVYVTAVAVNPAKPGGIDVGNVEVVDAW